MKFLIFFFLVSSFAYAEIEKIIHLVQLTPEDPDSHTLSRQSDAVKYGFDTALKDFSKEFPSCKFKSKVNIGHSSQEALYSKILEIGKLQNKHIVIGFSRSSYARLAAKAAVGSSLKGISIGASTTELRDINPNFYSVASPMNLQWDKINNGLIGNGCNADNTISTFVSSDAYSMGFRDKFLKSTIYSKKNVFFTNDFRLGKSFKESFKNKSCIFMGMNISTAYDFIHKLVKSKWKGHLFGVGDWYYFSKEFNALVKTEKLSDIKIYIPTGWEPSSTENAKKFSDTFKSIYKVSPDPVVAYTYDATKLALQDLCYNKGLNQLIPSEVKNLNLLRNYKSVGKSNNLISPVYFKVMDQ